MDILTLVLFFAYLLGFGYSLISLFKVNQNSDWFEKIILALGLGLCVFIVLGTIISRVGIPLYWWIFLLLSVVPAAFFIYKDYRFKKEKIVHTQLKLEKKHIIYFLLLLLFAFNFYTYTTGSFAYQYLEDDDPWTYAREMSYVSVEKTLDVPYFRSHNYLDPYPPGYTLIMGMLHQTSLEAQWTLKFFNSLIISLSFLFFFFMTKKLTQNNNIALASTFVLSMLPSYLGHFIWTHSLIPGLFFLLIYSYESIAENKNYLYLAGIVTAAILLTHPIQSLKIFFLVSIYFMIKWFYARRVPKEVLYSGMIGIMLSLFWFAFKFKSMIAMQNREGAAVQQALVSSSTSIGELISRAFGSLSRLFTPGGGSATRAYSFSDFFFAQKNNMINQPIGWGVIISLLLLVTVVILIVRYKNLKNIENQWLTITLVWFAFAFLVVNSMTFHLPVGLEAFRTWMLLAIPLSLLCGYGIVLISNSFHKYKWIIITLFVIGIFLTSGYYKYYHNTNPGWPPGGRFSMDEMSGLIWMKQNLPANSKVFAYTSIDKFVFGVNMYSCIWCADYRAFKEKMLDKDIPTIYSWLKKQKYQYLMLTARDLKLFKNEYYKDDANYTTEKIEQLYNQRIQEVGAMPDKFQLVHQTNGFLLFKVN